MTVEDVPEVLSLGIIVGGSTVGNRAWVQALRELTREIVHRSSGISSTIKVNVEFQVPGNLLQPDFEGVRVGAFRKAESLIKVQVALPHQPPADVRPALMKYLWSALDAVDAWAASKRRVVDTGPLRALVAALESIDG